MKGFIKAITVVILTMFVAISLIIFADADNNYDGFQYEVKNGEIVITGYTGEDKDVVVPYAIDKKPVRTIGEKAFYNLEIESIILSNNVKYIENLAFAGCQKLTNVTLSINLSSIGEEAFSGCDALPSIVIPNSVTEIGVGAFSYCYNLSDVKLSSNTKIIPFRAFWWCYNLKKINIPDGVEKIEESAFEQCGIVEYTFGKQLKEIRQHAFKGCKIKNIYIPKNVESLWWAFSSGDFVESIQVEKGNPIYDSRDNCNAIIYTADNGLLIGCKNTVIPNNVQRICGSAFADITSLKKINIPNNVSSIETGAFSNCHNLNKITLGDSVIQMGMDAFKSCENIKEVHISSLTNWFVKRFANEYSNPLSNGIAMLYVKGKIQNKIELPSHVRKYLFYGYGGLNEVTIPDSIYMSPIEASAFENCNNLISVINNSDRDIQLSSTDNGYIANYAMMLTDKDGNKQYKQDGYEYIESDEFLFGKQNDEYYLFAYLGDEEKIVLPEKIQGHDYEIKKIIGGYKELVLPNKMTAIPSGLFQGYTNLTNVYWPDNIVEIAESAFENCINLKNIVIPKSVKYIGPRAFCNCSSLSIIDLPNELLTIESETFSGCENLESIHLPQFLNRIGAQAFENCTNLKDIILPNDILTIEPMTFKGCKNLESIQLPLFLTGIESSAFQDCINLKDIILPNTVEHIEPSVFENCISLNSLVLPDSITYIGCCLFMNCSNLSYVKLSNNLTTIEEYVFENCTNLKKVSIGQNITELTEMIFGNNPALIIEGYAGSYIQQYANENGYTFVPFDEVIIQDEYVEIKGDIDKIPVGSTLVIEEDKEKSNIIKNQVLANHVCTYDIEIKNNNEILNVDFDVVVKIKLPENYDPARCKVYYVDETGNLISMRAIYESGYMIFTTNHFSAYAIVEHNVIFGDVNGDKSVNNKDLVSLLKYISNINAQIDANRIDTNGDGKVNNKDVTRLFQYLSKYNVVIY